MIKGKTNGLKSSEFLLTACATLAGVLMPVLETVFGSDNQWISIIGLVLAAIAPSAYATSRAKVKASLAAAEAVTEAGKRQANSRYEPPKGE